MYCGCDGTTRKSTDPWVKLRSCSASFSIVPAPSPLSVVTFAALNLSGTIAIVVALRVLADHIRGPVDAVLRFNDRNVKWLTIASIVLVLVWLVWQRRQGSTPIVSLDDVQEELEQ